MALEIKRNPLIAAVAAALMLPAMPAYSGGTITFGEDKSVSIGLGMRGSFSSVEDAAPNGTSRSQNFSLDSARIYLSGSLNKYIKGMLNTEKDIAGQGFQAIDANVQIAITPGVTIWAGRFLSPSDRANMAGPYYSLGGGYWSGIASRYGFNGGYIGRDDGVAVVGSVMDGKLAYAFGAFEGNTTFKIAPVATSTSTHRTGSDGLMYAGRLQMDFWDAEPGYYGTGNYLGGKDILAIGIAGRAQKNGAYSALATGDYASYSIDFLLEKKGVGPGALSIEAAGYDYDTDDVYLMEQGRAYSAGVGYIFDQKVGWGQVQPFVRYQKFTPDNNVDTKKYDVGVNYIIDGYNAQIGAVYSNTEVTGASDVDAFTVAMQFQF
ncbi:MAG: porin [Thiobacillus sp.]|uniref:porin n=1 Tax=Thiobacillus sp. TaxID=924 RepID=UPI00273430B1|nr:porin [Thiobacillus sp.]MDP3584132.1 porin [Thiobacillus sp.]